MKSLFLVAFGGAFGSVLRYLISIWLKQSYTYSFPWHTFLINILGCLLMGIAFSLVKANHADWLNTFVMIGILGGFTTYSSFGLESFTLISDQKYLMAFTYIGLTNILGLIGIYSGFVFTNMLSR